MAESQFKIITLNFEQPKFDSIKIYTNLISQKSNNENSVLIGVVESPLKKI